MTPQEKQQRVIQAANNVLSSYDKRLIRAGGKQTLHTHLIELQQALSELDKEQPESNPDGKTIDDLINALTYRGERVNYDECCAIINDYTIQQSASLTAEIERLKAENQELIRKLGQYEFRPEDYDN